MRATSTAVKLLSIFRLYPTIKLPQALAFNSLSLSSAQRHHCLRNLRLSPRSQASNREDIIRLAATTIAIRIPGACHNYLNSLSRIHSKSSSVVITTTMPQITYDILTQQNALTTNAIIEHYASCTNFIKLATAEGDDILARDDEDGEKLQKGIDIAKAKGVLDPNFVPEEYISIDVLGKSPKEVADEILTFVRGSSGPPVVVLCGLSGTGKGTTVATLQEKLIDEDKKQVICWSNGNVFRSVTLLAVTWCEQQDGCNGFNPARALTNENLTSFMQMLEFGKFNGKFDTKISGLGLDLLVSEVQNTALKDPKVSKNIPTVAEVTQGEVVLFASDAIQKMGEDSIFVLLEGREQTVNYVRTPLRFTLTLSDTSLIGKRRAAQRLAARTLGEVTADASVDDIAKVLDGQLDKMVMDT